MVGLIFIQLNFLTIWGKSWKKFWEKKNEFWKLEYQMTCMHGKLLLMQGVKILAIIFNFVNS